MSLENDVQDVNGHDCLEDATGYAAPSNPSTPGSGDLTNIRGIDRHVLVEGDASPSAARVNNTQPLGRSAWRGIRLGELRVAEARLLRVGRRYVREVWIYVDGLPAALVADDEDPAPYGGPYVDQLIAEIERRGGTLVIERSHRRPRLDGPARGGWVAVIGGAP